MLTKSLLQKEVRQWSEEVLESPNKDFNNMPACPFAKQSWNSGRVQVVLGEGGIWADLVDLIKNFDDTYDVIVYCGTDYDEISAEEFEDRLDVLADVAVPNDIWIMGTHPYADDIPHAVNQDNFEALTDDNYYQIFVQRLGHLVKSSDSIQRKGYYQNYTEENFNSLVTKRKEKWQAI
jgi:hypothetical protein